MENGTGKFNKSVVLPPLSSILNSPIPPLTLTSTPRKTSEQHPPMFVVTPLSQGTSMPFRSNSITLPLPTPSSATAVCASFSGMNSSSSFFNSHNRSNVFNTCTPTPLGKSHTLPALSTFLPTPPTQLNEFKHDAKEMKSAATLIDMNASTITSDASFQSIGSPISQTKMQKRSLSLAASGEEEKTFAFISHNQETFLSSEPSIDNAQLARRKRRRTSPTELKILAEEFERNTTPDRYNRDRIAKIVNMSEKAVQIWFQNKRQALRKSQKKDSHQISIELPAISTSQSSGLTENFNSSSDSLSSSGSSESYYPPSGVFTNETPTNNNEENVAAKGGQMFKFKTTAYGLVAPTKSKTRRQKPTMKIKIKSNNAPLVDITNVHNGQRILSGL